MNRIAVLSSNIAEVGWEPGGGGPDAGRMEVMFHSEALYEYRGVPLSVAFAVAVGAHHGSVGRAFNALVRGRYPYGRIA